MVNKVVLLGAGLAAIVLTGIAIASTAIVEHYFDGDWVMLFALAIAFVSYAPAHIARGVCSGMGRFHAYAFIMGADGVVRIIFCLLLAAVGVTAAGPYGLAVGLAPLVGVALMWGRGRLKTEPGPPASWPSLPGGMKLDSTSK